MVVKKKICVKILLHASIELGGSTCKELFFQNFNLNSSRLPSLSTSVMFAHSNTDILFGRVNYLYLATFTCPLVFPHEWQ